MRFFFYWKEREKKVDQNKLKFDSVQNRTTRQESVISETDIYIANGEVEIEEKRHIIYEVKCQRN